MHDTYKMASVVEKVSEDRSKISAFLISSVGRQATVSCWLVKVSELDELPSPVCVVRQERKGLNRDVVEHQRPPREADQD